MCHSKRPENITWVCDHFELVMTQVTFFFLIFYHISYIYLAMASLSPDDFRRHVLNGAAERVCSFLLYSEERIQMYLMSQKKTTKKKTLL